MPVARPELPARFSQACIRLQEQHQGRHQSRPVGAAPAVQQQRVFAPIQDFHKPPDFRGGRQPARRETDVFLSDIQPGGRATLFLVPGKCGRATTKVDHRADAAVPHDLFQPLCGLLGTAVHTAGNHGVQVSPKEHSCGFEADGQQ